MFHIPRAPAHACTASSSPLQAGSDASGASGGPPQCARTHACQVRFLWKAASGSQQDTARTPAMQTRHTPCHADKQHADLHLHSANHMQQLHAIGFMHQQQYVATQQLAWLQLFLAQRCVPMLQGDCTNLHMKRAPA